MRKGYEVTERIEGAHPLVPKYPLLPGDLLVLNKSGTFTKEAPGIAIGVLAVAIDDPRIVEVEFVNRGLNYTVIHRKGT